MSFIENKGYRIGDQNGAYFITTSIVGWVDLFTRRECAEILIRSLNYCQANKGLVIHAYVIMSNHIHLIISATKESNGLSAILRDFKKYTSKALLDWVLNAKRESRSDWMKMVFKYHADQNGNNKTFQVWQQDNHPLEVRYPKFTNQKLTYIHNNPVKAGVVLEPEHYHYSSARIYANCPYVEEPLSVSVIDFGVQEGFVFL